MTGSNSHLVCPKDGFSMYTAVSPLQELDQTVLQGRLRVGTIQQPSGMRAVTHAQGASDWDSPWSK